MAAKEIPSAPGYVATTSGAIWSRKMGQLKKLIPRVDEDGYHYVRLSYQRRYREVALHRLVAETWVQGWHPSLEVHHRDGNPANNSAQNLVCLTNAEHKRIHHIFVDDETLMRERMRANELIAALKPAVPGESSIRGLLRAVQSTETALKCRGIAL